MHPVDMEAFAAYWNQASSVAEVSQWWGKSSQRCSSIACKLRKRGFVLKHMPVPMKGNSERARAIGAKGGLRTPEHLTRIRKLVTTKFKPGNTVARLSWLNRAVEREVCRK